MPTNLQIAVRKVVSTNPATGEALHEFECASEPEVGAAVAQALAAQPAWADLGVRKRIAILRDFQRLLHGKKSEVAQLITGEAGKPFAITSTLVLFSSNCGTRKSYSWLGSTRKTAVFLSMDATTNPSCANA